MTRTSKPIRFGVMLPMWDYHVYDEVSFDQIVAITREAERLGYDYVTVDDHLQRGGAGRVFESLTTLSALAGQTTRIRFLTTVLCSMYRPPSLVAKMAATIDTISGGRLELGIGAGWKEEEARAYGVSWDGPKGRLDRLEEACQVILALWSQDQASFAGKYFHLENAICNPRPVQRPHPPLWIGGGGEKRTLRIAARFADGVNFAGPGIGSGAPTDPFEHFIHKREVLYAHCRDVGRDPARIALSSGVNAMLWGRSRQEVEARFMREATERSLSEPERQRVFASLQSAIATPRQALASVERFLAEGATYVTVARPTMEGLRVFAEEVMRQIRPAPVHQAPGGEA